MQLSCRREGNAAAAVILIHGWYADASVWRSLVPLLDLGDRSVLLPELRGAGRMRFAPGPWDEPTAVGDLVELLDASGVGRVVVIGHSMGGKIALALAAKIPERVESVVAVAPVPPQGLAFDAKAWMLYRAALEEDSVLASLIGLLARRRYPRAWAEHEAARARSAMSREAASGYLESFVSRDLSAAVRGLAVPVLALCGEEDAAIGVELTRSALSPLCLHLTVESVPGAAHYLPLEAPGALAVRINRRLGTSGEAA